MGTWQRGINFCNMFLLAEESLIRDMSGLVTNGVLYPIMCTVKKTGLKETVERLEQCGSCMSHRRAGDMSCEWVESDSAAVTQETSSRTWMVVIYCVCYYSVLLLLKCTFLFNHQITYRMPSQVKGHDIVLSMILLHTPAHTALTVIFYQTLPNKWGFSNLIHHCCLPNWLWSGNVFQINGWEMQLRCLNNEFTQSLAHFGFI